MRLLATVLKLLLPIALGASASLPAAAADTGAWRSRCEPTKGKIEGGCFVYQDLVLRQGGQRVLQFAAGYAQATPDPIALLSLPLGISLPPGVSLQVDEGKTITIMVERCEPTGCRAGLKLESDLLQELIAGRTLKVSFHDAERKPIEMQVALAGFRAALDEIKGKTPEN